DRIAPGIEKAGRNRARDRVAARLQRHADRVVSVGVAGAEDDCSIGRYEVEGHDERRVDRREIELHRHVDRSATREGVSSHSTFVGRPYLREAAARVARALRGIGPAASPRIRRLDTGEVALNVLYHPAVHDKAPLLKQDRALAKPSHSL